MLHEDQLVSELKELNNYLEKRHRVGGTTGERRQQAEQKGVFAPLSGLSGKEISSFFQGRPLVGVDGSLATYGASYPYVVTFFRALAHTTSSGSSNERIWVQEIFSPLLPRYQEKMEERISKENTKQKDKAYNNCNIHKSPWRTEARIRVSYFKFIRENLKCSSPKSACMC